MTEMECNITVIYKVYLVGLRKSTADQLWKCAVSFFFKRHLILLSNIINLSVPTLLD